MARWTGEPQITKILEGADQWKQRCLLDTGSLFTARALWTPENLSELRTRIVDNPLSGAESFYSKLEKKLRGASPVLLRCSGFSCSIRMPRSSAPTRSGRGFAQSGLFQGGNSQQSASGRRCAPRRRKSGTSFNTRLPDELTYVLSAVVALKSLASERRGALLSEAGVWDFCELVTEVPGGDVRSARHMLLYLCFPNSFERIASRGISLDVRATRTMLRQ